MQLRAWRETWMWLAASACGGAAPGWMTTPAQPKVSVFDAPPFATSTYVATVTMGDFGHPGPEVNAEHGAMKCGRLVELRGLQRDENLDPKVLADARATCDDATATALSRNAGFAYVVDAGGGRWMSAAELLAAAGPIDTPAKAVLAAWVHGGYDLGWSDGDHAYGSLEDAIVRRAGDGYDVAAGTRQTLGDCGGDHPREKVVHYRVTLHVDGRGTVTPRDRVATSSYDIADPCHPMGRRPEAFVDVASGGTLGGHLARAMHHEAESVRAFLRIARELRVHGAPTELIAAAAQAAEDERDHAARCARLAGLPLAIDEDALPARSLLALAIDNAREGCVGEAYAALVNVVQAQTAATAELRAHFAALAADELAHAALASAIAEWAEGRLTDSEQAEVRAAREHALRMLEAGCQTPRDAAVTAMGIPTGSAAAALLTAVRAAALRASPTREPL